MRGKLGRGREANSAGSQDLGLASPIPVPDPWTVPGWVRQARSQHPVDHVLGFRRADAGHFRRYGPSIAPVKEHTDLDLVGAAAELRRQGATRVVLIGASLGGAAVLVAGKQIPSASVIISVSAPAVFGDLDAATAAQTLDVPVLFLASKQDQPFGGDAQTLFAERHRPGDRIVLYPGYLHGIDLVEGPMGAQVRALMLSFIRSHTGS